LVSRALLLSLAVLLFAAPVLGQANEGKAVIYLGMSYNQKNPAHESGSGFFGIDMFAGKMINNNLCLGASAGYDIIHYHRYIVPSSPEEGGGEKVNTLAMIPVLFKARYYYSFSQMMQISVSAGLGAYNQSPRYGSDSWLIGGSIGISFDYWFLLVNGVGFELEYHMVTENSLSQWDYKKFADNHMNYWQARVSYGVIKF